MDIFSNYLICMIGNMNFFKRYKHCVLRIYKNVTIKRNIVVNKNIFSKCILVKFIKNLDNK